MKVRRPEPCQLPNLHSRAFLTARMTLTASFPFRIGRAGPILGTTWGRYNNLSQRQGQGRNVCWTQPNTISALVILSCPADETQAFDLRQHMGMQEPDSCLNSGLRSTEGNVQIAIELSLFLSGAVCLAEPTRTTRSCVRHRVRQNEPTTDTRLHCATGLLPRPELRGRGSPLPKKRFWSPITFGKSKGTTIASVGSCRFRSPVTRLILDQDGTRQKLAGVATFLLATRNPDDPAKVRG